MNPKMLLLHMSHRLYEDIKFVTAQNPTQIVDDDGTRAYNAVLAKTRKYINAGDFMDDFQDWTPRSIKYKDALVAVGQLHAMIQACVESGNNYDFPNIGHSDSESYNDDSVDIEEDEKSESPFRKESSAHLQDPNIVGDEQFETSSKRDSSDKELYGTDDVKRNEDGTIPFSLD